MGAASDLVFAQAVPVTLHLVAPGDATASAVHDFTASLFFRSVAFRDVATASGTYKGPTLDAVELVHEEGTEHRATLRFVPIETGTFTAYSSQGVTDGRRYAEIVQGTITPDLTTGDADKGMTIDLEVVGDEGLTIFQASSPDRPADLDADPRRDSSHPVWEAASVTTIGILAQEGLDPMTGESRFTFDWTTRTLTQNTGHVLEVENEAGNLFDHDFTALGMLSDSVVRAAEDAHAEIRAPYFSGASITPGLRIRLYLVPTIAREYQTYCQIGVSHADNGAPDLTTGHAGAGMQDVVTVVP